MKKIFCCLLVFVILTSGLTVFADSETSQEMEKILSCVKQKVDIPEKLTEFTPYTTEILPTGETEYNFLWQDTDGNAHMEVSCNGDGRIKRYYFYDNSLKSDKKLSVLSKNDILDFAEQFLKKTLPESFENENDILVFEQEMWSVNNLNYNLRYIRMRDGIKVKDNDVSLYITVCDDVPYVRSMSTYLDFETEFSDVPGDLEGYVQKYMEAFPVELIYQDEVQSYWKNENTDETVKTVLVYRHKDNNAGYILASNGEIAEEDAYDLYGGSGGGVTNEKFESSADTALRQEFTEQELAELDKIKTVISKEKASEILKKLPHINWNSSLEINVYEIRRAGEKYMVFTEFRNEDKDRTVYATFDGETGELIDLYNRVPYPQDEGELADVQKTNIERKIDEFLKVASPEKLKNNFTLQSTDVQGKRVYRDYDRNVSGIRYISDGVMVEYDAEADVIVTYRMDYEENSEFKKPDGIISDTEAYAKILEYSPLELLYVRVDGEYKVCYTVSEYGTEVDAFTGEKYNPYGRAENGGEYKYSDLEGHWAKDKIMKLAEAQIGLEGEKFNPDEPITQFDLLRLFAAGIWHNGYLDYDEDELYEEFVYSEIISADEKNPDSTVKREDAFVYMIRLEGLEDVAKLSEIFKVEYKDGNQISEGKVGYPAILTGMGIICGNGGEVRPQAAITRAEAAVMIYNYMIK